MNFLLIFCCAFCLTNCNKTDDINIDKYFNDLHDTLISPYGFYNPIYFDVDLDKDHIPDVSIKTYDEYSVYGSFEYYIQIYSQNGYEISFSTIVDTSFEWTPSKPDTSFYYYSVMMPTINDIDDIITINDNYTEDTIMIVYNKVPHPVTRPYSKGISRNQWVGIGYKYIAFRKLSETEHRLAWLKVSVISSTEIKINSCRYFEKKDEITIEDD
jgi:hypothetical protein